MVDFAVELANNVVSFVVEAVGFVAFELLVEAAEVAEVITWGVIAIESVSQPLKQHLYTSSFLEYVHPPLIPQYPYCDTIFLNAFLYVRPSLKKQKTKLLTLITAEGPFS